MDRCVIGAIERRTDSRLVRSLARGGLNPAHSMAKLLAGQAPWHRDNRPTDPIPPFAPGEAPEGVPPFQMDLTVSPEVLAGGLACIGGAATPAFRLSRSWQLAADVGGCKALGLPGVLSAGTIHYRIGPRWSEGWNHALTPHAQLLAGGAKLSAADGGPEKDKLLRDIRSGMFAPASRRDAVLDPQAANGFSIAAGAGLALRLTPALALRLVNIEYTRNWAPPVAGIDYSHSLRFSPGLLVKMGTW
ncbi:MAG: hypothetical protein R2729_06365 [Bryobacteraceae bacterium]